jgi:hypothetical protein
VHGWTNDHSWGPVRPADLTLEIVTQACDGDLAEAVAGGWRLLANSQAPVRRSQAYSDVDPTVAAESFILAKL